MLLSDGVLITSDMIYFLLDAFVDCLKFMDSVVLLEWNGNTYTLLEIEISFLIAVLTTVIIVFPSERYVEKF